MGTQTSCNSSDFFTFTQSVRHGCCTREKNEPKLATRWPRTTTFRSVIKKRHNSMLWKLIYHGKAGAPYPTSGGIGGAPSLPPTSYQSSYGAPPPVQPSFNPHYGAPPPQHGYSHEQASAPPQQQHGYAPPSHGYPPQSFQQQGYGPPHQAPAYGQQPYQQQFHQQGHHGHHGHQQHRHDQHYDDEEYDRHGQPKKKKDKGGLGGLLNNPAIKEAATMAGGMYMAKKMGGKGGAAVAGLGLLKKFGKF